MLRKQRVGPSLDGQAVALDCRWLGMGGAGRVTELLLAQLRDLAPSGSWLLWGDPALLEPHVFPGSRVVPWRGDPTRLFGQADLMRVPAADVVVYLHQIRPLRPGHSITIVHDTIPLRYGGSVATRALKRLFMVVACRLSDLIVTVSESSAEAITRDLGIARWRILVMSLGVDPARLSRLRAIRARGEREDMVLYVGRFASHKNLERLCRAFPRTDFRASGGRLLLVGGAPDEVGAIEATNNRLRLDGIYVRGKLREDELDTLIATCRAVVQPSLEEGYGLPAVEAAAAGIPVAVSPTGYATEIPARLASVLDPVDVASIAAAIDDAVGRGESEPWEPPSTVASVVLDVVQRALAG